MIKTQYEKEGKANCQLWMVIGKVGRADTLGRQRQN